MNWILLKHEKGFAPHLGYFLLFFVFFFTSQMTFRGSDIIGGGTFDLQVIIRLLVLAAVFCVCLLNYKVFFSHLRYMPLFFHAVMLMIFLVVTIMPWSFNFYSVYAVLTHLIMFYTVVVLTLRFGFENALYYYVAGVCIFCLCSLIAYYAFPTVGRYWFFNDHGVFFQSTRMSGIAGHPNSLGVMCTTALLGLLHLVCIRYPVSKIVYIGAMIILLCLFLTDSRTSQGGTLLMAGVYLAVYLRLFSVAMLAGVSFSLLVLASIVFSWDILFEVLQLVSRSGDVEEITSLTGRSHVWEQLFILMERRPVLGWGHATMGSVLLEYKDEIGFEVGQAHNLYLQIFFSSGAVGFFVYMLTLLSSVFVAFVQAHRDRAPFLLCVLIYIMLASFTEAFMLSSIANNAYLLFVLCLTAVSIECKKHHQGG